MPLKVLPLWIESKASLKSTETIVVVKLSALMPSVSLLSASISAVVHLSEIHSESFLELALRVVLII